MIISELHNSTGFFSCFFFMMNHYIYSKYNNLNFKINSDNWLFKHSNGWLDYFEDISLLNNENNSISSNNTSEIFKIAKYGDILHNYSIIEYKKVLWDIYKYNKNTIKHINETKSKLGLINLEYGSIFIRRGDKLFYESKYFPTEKYVELLLEKYPDCKIIFLQTDDYNTYIDIEKYINSKELNIQLITLCNKNQKGVMTYNHGHVYTNIPKNSHYINNIKNELLFTKPVTEMSKDEIYNHTMTMLVGLDIVFHSKYCIFDYQSNVSRFIKLAHYTPENVFDIEGIELDMKKEICPAYTLCAYNNDFVYE